MELEDEGWENERLAKVKIKALRGHIGGVSSCCFLDGINLVLSAGLDKTLRIWNCADVSMKRTLSGHKDEVTSCRSTPDGRKIVSSSLDKTLILWDASTGQPLLESCHEGMVMSCDISHDGRYMLSCSDLDNEVTVWDIRQRKSIKTFKHHTSTVLSCRFSRCSYTFCSTSMDLTATVAHMLDYRDYVKPNIVLKLRGHINMVSSCDFSLDGRRICTGSWDKTVKLWDVNAGTYRNDGPVVLDGHHDGSVTSCRLSKDGSTLLSASYDESLVVWDVENGCKKFALQGHTSWVTDCDFSSDEKCVISSSMDGTLRYWNIEKGDEIPVVIQNRKNIGLRLLSCQECNNQFSISQAQDMDSIKYCVFCRLKQLQEA